jgi:hypothetical protein
MALTLELVLSPLSPNTVNFHIQNGSLLYSLIFFLPGLRKEKACLHLVANVKAKVELF